MKSLLAPPGALNRISCDAGIQGWRDPGGGEGGSRWNRARCVPELSELQSRDQSGRNAFRQHPIRFHPLHASAMGGDNPERREKG